MTISGYQISRMLLVNKTTQLCVDYHKNYYIISLSYTISYDKERFMYT